MPINKDKLFIKNIIKKEIKELNKLCDTLFSKDYFDVVLAELITDRIKIISRLQANYNDIVTPSNITEDTIGRRLAKERKQVKWTRKYGPVKS